MFRVDIRLNLTKRDNLFLTSLGVWRRRSNLNTLKITSPDYATAGYYYSHNNKKYFYNLSNTCFNYLLESYVCNYYQCQFNRYVLRVNTFLFFFYSYMWQLIGYMEPHGFFITFFIKTALCMFKFKLLSLSLTSTHCYYYYYYYVLFALILLTFTLY